MGVTEEDLSIDVDVIRVVQRLGGGRDVKNKSRFGRGRYENSPSGDLFGQPSGEMN